MPFSFTVVSRANEATDLRRNAASRSDGFGGSGRLVFSWFFGFLQPLELLSEQGYPQADASAPLTLASGRLWRTRVRRDAACLGSFWQGSRFAVAFAVEHDSVGAIA